MGKCIASPSKWELTDSFEPIAEFTRRGGETHGTDHGMIGALFDIVNSGTKVAADVTAPANSA